MVNLSTLISNSEITGPGGLFDFDATLPLVMVQFLILIVVLNTILYNPLLTIIEERKDYVLNNLSKASELLVQTNELITTYEEKLSVARKQAQLEITNSQKIHKENLEQELNRSQESIDNLLSSIIIDLSDKKTVALNNLESIVKSLCKQIDARLLI
uniref:ATP synthase CF0 subunit II n=1 Tax=Toxarium undulatum TaxID=210620 RepID=A0A1D8DC72_9STRA|nr:ATP synthase CF0 subunit II [Toxarium undulatum]AOS86613.1 ATP synthase CF0 subunit II [Toxarium undulatum]